MGASGRESADWQDAPWDDTLPQAEVLRLGGIELSTRSGRGAEVQRRRQSRRWLRRLRHMFVMGLAFGALAGMVLAGLLLVSPSVETATARAMALDRAHHGQFLAAPLPWRVAAAFVAAGDRGLYSQAGADPATLAGMLFGGSSAGGGRGWFYLQVARDLYGGSRPGPLTRIEQALVGIKLDLRYSPATILGLYANITDFGHGFVGLASASCGYFARHPAGLSWGQAAMLAAIARAPAADDPFVHMARARGGEQAVLRLLTAAGQLTSRQAMRAYDRPLRLSRARPDSRSAPSCLMRHRGRHHRAATA